MLGSSWFSVDFYLLFCYCWLSVLFIVSLVLTLACLARLVCLDAASAPSSILYPPADDACELKIVINAWLPTHNNTHRTTYTALTAHQKQNKTHTHEACRRRIWPGEGNCISEGSSKSLHRIWRISSISIRPVSGQNSRIHPPPHQSHSYTKATNAGELMCFSFYFRHIRVAFFPVFLCFTLVGFVFSFYFYCIFL